MPAPILQARDLRKCFRTPAGDLPVLCCVDLEVAPGESVSIRGESGSGKTTLLYCLAGLEEIDQGQIDWDGKSATALRPPARAKARADLLGFVFQSYYLTPAVWPVRFVPKTKPGPAISSDGSDWPDVCIMCRDKSPVARPSAWPLPGLCSTARGCSWQMSPLATWMSARRRKSSR